MRRLGGIPTSNFLSDYASTAIGMIMFMKWRAERWEKDTEDCRILFTQKNNGRIILFDTNFPKGERGYVYMDSLLNKQELLADQVINRQVEFEKITYYLQVGLGPNAAFGRIEPEFSINVEILGKNLGLINTDFPLELCFDWNVSFIHPDWPSESDGRKGLGYRSPQPIKPGLVLVFDNDETRKSIVVSIEKIMVEIDAKFGFYMQMLFCNESELVIARKKRLAKEILT